MSSLFTKILQYIPVPKSMSFEHAGIDIGTNHIRHIFLKKRGQYVEIQNFGVYSIETLNQNVQLSEQVHLLEVLKKIKKENRYKYVEVSLPEDLVYVYTAEVDGDDDESIRSQVEFRIEENVPLRVDEAIFDITQVLYQKDVHKTLVSVAVVAKKTVTDYVELFKNASMEIVSFLVQNQALSKTLIKKDDTNTYCIIAIEQRNIVVSVVSSGIVLYTSTLGQSVFENNQLIKDVEVFRDLVKDINKVIIFWLSYIQKNPGYGFKSIEAILLSSTHIEILESEFAEILARELSIPVRFSDVWLNIPMDPYTVPQIYKKDSYQYATSIGLAMPKL